MNKKATAEKAIEILEKYKSEKRSVDERIIENERFWKMQKYSKEKGATRQSAWLFNCIINKHADAMDSMPEAVLLPREEGDIPACRLLSELLPCALEEAEFEKVYSRGWYDKLKYGSAAYGVFWNPAADSGLGKIEIEKLDLLSLFWEGGINDIQDSENLFYLRRARKSDVIARYPKLKDKLSGEGVGAARHYCDDWVDDSGKCAVIDWYYKKKEGRKTLLHYAKICAGEILYSSEEDEKLKGRGFYDHGLYPVFIDSLYPVESSPCGYGIIDMMRSSSEEIDALSTAITDNARMAARRRYFIRGDGAVNEKEFADFRRPFVHYMGSGDPSSSVMPIDAPPLPENCFSVLNAKIEELKETSGNRDFSQGSVTGGVTAASAIAALQEAGSKTSRAMISASYFTFSDICRTVIELIRQFYTAPRIIRCRGGEALTFLAFDGREFRRGGSGAPVVDVKVRAVKKSPFARASQNELALRLYEAGVFHPQNAGAAKILLSMLEFEGRDEVQRKVCENGGAEP